VYIPPHFAVDDREVLDQVIRENSFATLISSGSEEPFATHIPLLLEGDELIGHMARANSHWKLFDGRPALAIFSGPHAYVSPRLYVTTPNVPTWNYVTVHVYGKPEVIAREEEAGAILRRSLDVYDPLLPRTPELEAYMASQVRGIVAFRIPIERIEGKFKLNQNKKPEDREAVVAAFSGSAEPAELAVAGIMSELYARNPAK
jgi:transcriptional regulator